MEVCSVDKQVNKNYMNVIGVILTIIGIVISIFWIDLLKKREYDNDRSVFWLIGGIALGVFVLAKLCF